MQGTGTGALPLGALSPSWPGAVLACRQRQGSLCKCAAESSMWPWGSGRCFPTAMLPCCWGHCSTQHQSKPLACCAYSTWPLAQGKAQTGWKEDADREGREKLWSRAGTYCKRLCCHWNALSALPFCPSLIFLYLLNAWFHRFSVQLQFCIHVQAYAHICMTCLPFVWVIHLKWAGKLRYCLVNTLTMKPANDCGEKGICFVEIPEFP